VSALAAALPVLSVAGLDAASCPLPQPSSIMRITHSADTL